jgi:hypothetical protein
MKFRINQMAAAIAVLGASSMVPAAAADGVAAAGSEQPTQLEPVVVEDTRLQPVPAASQVGEETLRALRPATSDTASLLRDVPGVQLQGAGGVSSLPVIRGLADDRNRITVDGMDLIASCPNHMNPPLSYLDPNGVSKLRVISRRHAGQPWRRQHRRHDHRRIAGAALRCAGPGSAGERPGRGVLPQQRQRLGWQPVGGTRQREPQCQLQCRRRRRRTTTRPAATSRTSPQPATRDTRWLATRSDRRPTRRTTTSSDSPTSSAIISWSSSTRIRTCPSNCSRTSGWTCWAIPQTASTCAIWGSTTGASSRHARTTRRWTT